MVGSADVSFKIQLEALALKHATYCRLEINLKFILFYLIFDFYLSYEPELFPGLIYRIIQPKIVLLIFNSGKVVLTGKEIFCFEDDCIHFFLLLLRSKRTS